MGSLLHGHIELPVQKTGARSLRFVRLAPFVPSFELNLPRGFLIYEITARVRGINRGALRHLIEALSR